MTQKTINSSPRRPLSLRQLLGIAHDGDPLWDQVRAMQLQASQQFLPLKMAMLIVYASCLALTLRDAYGVAALAAWCGLVIAASIACPNALRSEELGGARGRARVQSLWRSEERRGGKECVRPCRSRWSAYH